MRLLRRNNAQTIYTCVCAKTHQLLQQRGPEWQVEGPHLLAPWGEVGQDACRKITDLHLWTVQQRADVIQKTMNHQLTVQLPHLSDVILNTNTQNIQNEIR